MQDIQRIARDLKPILQIGKNGLTEGSIELIKRELQQKKLIKIKILRSALPEQTRAEKTTLAQKAASETNATLVSLRGNIITLHKR